MKKNEIRPAWWRFNKITVVVLNEIWTIYVETSNDDRL